MKVTMRRVAGSFRFTWGQDGGSASPRLRRRSRHSPTGMSSNPRTNSAGTNTKMMMPTYGFVRNPSSSSAMRNRNSSALAVVNATPIPEMRLRRAIARTDRINRLGYLFFRLTM